MFDEFVGKPVKEILWYFTKAFLSVVGSYLVMVILFLIGG